MGLSFTSMVLAYEQRGGFEPKIVDQYRVFSFFERVYSIIALATIVVVRFYYALLNAKCTLFSFCFNW